MYVCVLVCACVCLCVVRVAGGRRATTGTRSRMSTQDRGGSRTMSQAGLHPSISETHDDEGPMEVGCSCVVL